MTRRVQWEIDFEVPDGITNDEIQTIVNAAFVQIDEARLPMPDEIWNEAHVDTDIKAYGLTIDGEITETWEEQP